MHLGVPESNKVANWRPLAHWAMAIPHMIVGYVLNLVAGVATMVAWFIILFTGKMPDGIANFIIMSQRYNLRAGAFYLGLTETYPPFTFDTVATDPGDHDVTLSIGPQLTGRNRLTVFFRIFMLIPLIIVMYLYMIVVGIVMFIAWFAVLFTGTYPDGMRRLTVGFMRFGQRMATYGSLLTDVYPSFGLTDP